MGLGNVLIWRRNPCCIHDVRPRKSEKMVLSSNKGFYPSLTSLAFVKNNDILASLASIWSVRRKAMADPLVLNSSRFTRYILQLDILSN